MALNDKPCKSCKNFDRIVFGDDSKKTSQGWCAAKSIYHYQEQPGQVFPVGVKRAAPGELATPVIVKAGEVITNCIDYKPKK